MTCFQCEKIGHVRKDCPTNRPPVSGMSRAASNRPPAARTFNMTIQNAVLNTYVIEGTLLLNFKRANVLFDFGGTKSFISRNFAKKLNLYVVPLREFDVILGMDWFSSNGAQIDCERKKVRIRVQNGKEIVFKGQRRTQKFMNIIQAKTLLKKGNKAYLAYVMDTKKEVPNIHDIPIVNEFEDVFPENLPGLPPDREIEFTIELAQEMTPVSKAPNRLAPIEMKELAPQLQELLDNGMIRPSVSS
ncbi:hypothetical protein AgCh_005263 [Apium graveolens]